MLANHGNQESRWGLDVEYLSRAWRDMFSIRTLHRDVMAGAVVALVSLPLNLSFAAAANVEPEVGIIAGIVGGFLAALFGGSSYSITGPAAIMGVFLIQLRIAYGTEGVLSACFVCGLMQIATGLAGWGRWVRRIPQPVVVGFTNGLAVLIVVTQIPNVLGMNRYFDVYAFEAVSIWQRWDKFIVVDAIVGAVAVIAILATPRSSNLPTALLGVIAATILAFAIEWPAARDWLPDHLTRWEIDRLGPTPLLLHAPEGWAFDWSQWLGIATAALGLYLLTTIQAALCALTCDVQTNTQHHGNQELIGQGIANAVVPFFGGIPVTGVFARSAAGIRAGARTRMAALCHVAILFMFTRAFADQIASIPSAALAGVLVATGARMVQIERMRELTRASRTDGCIMWLTFALTVFTTNMIIGVLAGMVVAVGLTLWRSRRTSAETNGFQQTLVKQRLETMGELPVASRNGRP